MIGSDCDASFDDRHLVGSALSNPIWSAGIANETLRIVARRQIRRLFTLMKGAPGHLVCVPHGRAGLNDRRPVSAHKTLKGGARHRPRIRDRLRCCC